MALSTKGAIPKAVNLGCFLYIFFQKLATICGFLVLPVPEVRARPLRNFLSCLTILRDSSTNSGSLEYSLVKGIPSLFTSIPLQRRKSNSLASLRIIRISSLVFLSGIKAMPSIPQDLK
ncbi:hypothetical protein ES707_07101 [subsurface metagenome]